MDFSLRGKCKELSEQLAKEKGYELIRGWYHCPIWGRQEHWWCKDEDGNIHDPTKAQFPSNGIGEYEEFAGVTECAECGKEVREEDFIMMGRYVVCSDRCACRLVGV